MEIQPSAAILNVANTLGGTTMLGPGLRAVVWVQGCRQRCPDCIAPEWLPETTARLVRVDALLDELLANPAVEGFTFSGGEPMLQAAGLALLIQRARIQRPGLTLICYTGYRLEDLQTPQALGLEPPGVAALLAVTDVLIDGPYLRELNNQRGLSGSRNQHVHHLTGRLQDYDFETGPRKVEIRVEGNHAMLVGVPPANVKGNLAQAIAMSRKKLLSKPQNDEL